MSERTSDSRVGVWVVGARGAVSVCSMVGAAALEQGVESTTGMVSALADFDGLDLVDPGQFVFGGHDLGSTPLGDAAASFRTRTGVIRDETLRAVREDLAAIDARIAPGVTLRHDAARNGVPTSASDAVARVVADVRVFIDREALDRVILVNLASTEAPPSDALAAFDEPALAEALAGPGVELTDSVVYACAAVELGAPFINFTPSPGFDVPALAARAARAGICHAGNDGKTGETLVKTVLAPMFVARNFRVLTWHGYNLLGNADGAALNDPVRRAAKLESKSASLERILAQPGMQAKVSIDYAPSLDDWKTAWDFVHFEGFLGAKMSLQFTWQGCDSALAAPLVLDLIRFVEHAARSGESGPLTHLASFFKDPIGVEHAAFHRQVDLLKAYAGRTVEERA